MADDATQRRTATQLAKTRAQSIANRYRMVMEMAEHLTERDPNNAVLSQMNLCAAMVAYRVREFGIDLDFNKQLKLDGLLGKQSYELLAVPVANATIGKGTNLTEAEGKKAILAYASGHGTVDR